MFETVTAQTTEVISATEIAAECRHLEKTVLRRGFATEEELAPYRPGGDKNTDTGAWGWFRYHTALQRRHAPAAPRPETWDEEDYTVIKTFRNTPLTLRLRGVIPPDLPCESPRHPPEVKVYPKSFYSLIELAGRGHVTGNLGSEIEELRFSRKYDHQDPIYRAHLELGYQLAVMVWCVTTPGVHNPFDYPVSRPEPPTWVLGLDPQDVHRIHRANLIVNNVRLQAVEHLISGIPSPDGKGRLRPSWSAFFASAGKTLGVAPSTLMRDWALAEVLAQIKLASAAERAALDEAKHDSA